MIHFDSHLDTWRPKVFGGAPTTQASINHGTYFYHAYEEGLLANDSNIHAGIRTTLSGLSDYDNDARCGFEIVEAREIDTLGTAGIIKKIRERVGTEKPVYLSIDIDTLDPACESPTRSHLPPLSNAHTPVPVIPLDPWSGSLTHRDSRPSNRDPRNRGLDDARATHHLTRAEGSKFRSR